MHKTMLLAVYISQLFILAIPRIALVSLPSYVFQAPFGMLPAMHLYRWLKPYPIHDQQMHPFRAALKPCWHMAL